MIERKTWEEFKDARLLWWINRILHTFGWAIVYDMEPDGTLTAVYPARVTYRGFSEQGEEAGFVGLTDYLVANIHDIKNDLTEE